MRASLLLTSLLLAGASLEAQRIGDYLRVRVGGSAEWQYGTLMGLDSARFHIQHPSTELSYSITEVERMDVLRRRNVAVNVVLGALTVMAGVALGDALEGDSRPLTGSRGGDFALAAGLGALVNAVHVALYPFCWRRVRG